MLAVRSACARWLLHPAAKPVLFVACLLPLVWLVWATVGGALGANPAERLIRSTGDWALRLLCLTLAVTPLRKLLNLPALARFRRMLGLFTFAWACVHLLCYAWFDMGLEVAEIAADIAQRPFILMGMGTFAVLLVLAITSFQPFMGWLGGRRWQALHRSVYLAAALALMHFFWMRAGKRDFNEVLMYAAIVASLLAARVLLRRRKSTAMDAKNRAAHA